jgi:hypothetical protein
MILLIDEAESAALRRQMSHVIIMHKDPARAEPCVAGDRFQQGRLARSRGSDDESVSTFRNFQRDFPQIERPHTYVQVVQANHWRSCGCSTRTTTNIVSATRRRITAAGTADRSPKVVNRSKM